MLAWVFSCVLMCQEYKRGLSEAKYSHQLFWVLNLIFNIVTGIAVIIISQSFEYNSKGECTDTNTGDCIKLKTPIYSIVSISFYTAANLALVIFLILTRRRSRHNPRYAGNYIDEDLLLETTPRAG
jgi:hypothetical protein